MGSRLRRYDDGETEALMPKQAAVLKRQVCAAKVGATVGGWCMNNLPGAGPRWRRGPLDALKPLKSEIGIFS